LDKRLRCEECGRLADADAEGWRGLLGLEGFEFVRGPRRTDRFGGRGSAAWSAPPAIS